MVAMELPLQWLLVTQEEQAGGSSANYDVELIHLAEAHRDILRAGLCVCVATTLNLNYITYFGLHVHMQGFSVSFHFETCGSVEIEDYSVM